MPLYTFKCPSCGNTSLMLLNMSQAGRPQKCCVCGLGMNRDYQADLVNVGNKEYAKPLHSDSLAISVTQVEEHQRKFPDIKIDSQCRPVFENYQQHNNYLEATGFVKPPQKKKPKGKIIKT